MSDHSLHKSHSKRGALWWPKYRANYLHGGNLADFPSSLSLKHVLRSGRSGIWSCLVRSTLPSCWGIQGREHASRAIVWDWCICYYTVDRLFLLALEGWGLVLAYPSCKLKVQGIQLTRKIILKNIVSVTQLRFVFISDWLESEVHLLGDWSLAVGNSHAIARECLISIKRYSICWSLIHRDTLYIILAQYILARHYHRISMISWFW